MSTRKYLSEQEIRGATSAAPAQETMSPKQQTVAMRTASTQRLASQPSAAPASEPKRVMEEQRILNTPVGSIPSTKRNASRILDTAQMTMSPECLRYLASQLPEELDNLPQAERARIIRELSEGGKGYKIGGVMAKGAECLLYQGSRDGYQFCVKSIRNWKDKWLGNPATRNNQGKLQTVSYTTKVRHLTNEFKIGQLLSAGAGSETVPCAVRFYDLRKVTRLGLELGWDLLMERINGIDLSDYALLKTMSVEDKVRVCLQICQAISSMHQHRLIHLDIKPSNFMLDRSGKVRIIDFGISVPAGFKSKSVAGTAGYFSPEQICRAQLKEDTDIFALGVTFAIIFGGKQLLQTPEEASQKSYRKNAAADMEKNHFSAISDIPELNTTRLKGIADVIRACSVYQRESRIPSCLSLANKLRTAALEAGLTV